MQKLENYIKANFDSKAEFARRQGVLPQTVTRWINSDYHVIDNKMVRTVKTLKKQ